MRSLGADDVIDYHATRFEDTLRDIDVVPDTIGGETRERSWRVLRKGGVLVTLVSAIPADVAERHSVRGGFFIVMLAEIEASLIKSPEAARLATSDPLGGSARRTAFCPYAR